MEGLVVIFVNKWPTANFLSGWFYRNNISAVIYNGHLLPHEREKVLSQFCQGKSRFLIAANVSALGTNGSSIVVVTALIPLFRYS